MRRTMVRKTALLSVAASIALAPAAAAGSGRRVDDAQYNYTTGLGSPSGVQGELTLGFAQFETLEGENKVSLTITDASGLPVFANAAQDADGDGRFEKEHEFCGSTRGLAIQGGVDLQVFVREGTCNGSPSLPTSGSIQAVFRSARR